MQTVPHGRDPDLNSNICHEPTADLKSRPIVAQCSITAPQQQGHSMQVLGSVMLVSRNETAFFRFCQIQCGQIFSYGYMG